MKKFGKRNLQVNENECIYQEYEDDNIYEKEFRKKLNYSNSFVESNQKFLLFKKQKKLENKNAKENIHIDQFGNDSNNSKSSLNQNKKLKLKRLSELEESNLYFILNIAQDSTKDNIKRAYKSLCLTHHPDKGGDSETFSKINKAYQILSNDTCKKLYDKFSFSAMNLIDQIINSNDIDVANVFMSDINDDLDSLDLQFFPNKR